MEENFSSYSVMMFPYILQCFCGPSKRWKQRNCLICAFYAKMPGMSSGSFITYLLAAIFSSEPVTFLRRIKICISFLLYGLALLLYKSILHQFRRKKKSVLFKGRWSGVFGNADPVHIEVGMGKGQFIHGMAKENPHINYIGIERYSTVLLRAIQKMETSVLNSSSPFSFRIRPKRSKNCLDGSLLFACLSLGQGSEKFK